VWKEFRGGTGDCGRSVGTLPACAQARGHRSPSGATRHLPRIGGICPKRGGFGGGPPAFNKKKTKCIQQNTKKKDQKILELNSMQSITSDEIKNGVTYLSVMEDNLKVLKEALK